VLQDRDDAAMEGEKHEAMQRALAALKTRGAGLALIALGVLALSAPLAVGRWSLTVLGIPLLVLGLIEAHATFKSPRRGEPSAYLPSVLAVLAGNLLLMSSALVVGALLVLLFLILLADGAGKLLTVWRKPAAERAPAVVNALIDFAAAALLWWLDRILGAERAIGIVIGLYVTAAGWRMLMAPAETAAPAMAASAPTLHPDSRLGLPANEAFARLRAETEATAPTVLTSDLMWMSTLVGVFLAIHVGRMPISNTLLGIVSPFVATVGDLIMTVTFAALVVLPWRLIWRRCTRPAERIAWSAHLRAPTGRAVHHVAHRLIGSWLASRFGFCLRLRAARLSLPAALMLLLRLGLPVTAFFVAFNPVWGFSWYFNTESWASGVYQKMTELRVDPWRAAMVDAVTRAYGGGDELFRIKPAGIDGGGDFSFLVIGDPGEGDPSQYSLVSRYLQLGLRDDVKFLVVASDVIYPAGAMSDYETNFYLPFQGFAKPIYAIPGNHDWFDALEGFNANLLEEKAAGAALAARVDADLGLTSTTARRIDRLIGEAARLRALYGVKAANQRATFFELQTEDFALIAIDTGILRTVDERQWTWLERALGRSRGKLIIAIVGHPRFAGGYDTAPPDGGAEGNGFPKELGALYQLLAQSGVRIAMAGDTHDFEYYRQQRSGGDGGRELHHVVTGGGGAYLSIGTALDFARAPAVADWAFHPRTDALRAKMDAEMPLWKQPFWYWINWLGAWPFSIEALSGVFDFNRAPFFQTFMEVRVERSQRRVVLALNGVSGPLRWRDLQIGGGVRPPGVRDNDAAEIIVPMD
jgi:uncharacterized membrane protein HdeD (DUF308 family)